MSCPNNCSGSGFCAPPNFTCVCLKFYSGPDCSDNIATLYPGPWYGWRALAILFHLSTFVTSVAIYKILQTRKLELDNEAALQSFSSKNRIVILSICLSFSSLLYPAIDPFGFEGSGIPLWILSIATWSKAPFLMGMFSMILYDWAIVYSNTCSILKQAEMLAKINQKYQSNITLEDVVKRMKITKKFKIPLIVVNAIMIVVCIGLVISSVNPALMATFMFLVSFYWTIVFIILAVGFFIYGTKLLKLLPNNLQKKMQRVQQSTLACSILFVLGNIVIAGLFMFETFALAVAIHYLYDTLIFLLQVIILTAYFKLKKGFPFVTVVGAKTAASDTETSNGISSTAP